MSVHLVSLSSDICEDDFEEGEGKSTGCGYQGEKVGKTFDTFPQMLAYLEKNYGLSANETDYGVDCNNGQRQLYYSKTVANHSEAQNGGWFEPTKEELARWRAGALMLYSEDYVINWHQVA
jgi:hypothetical protein